VLFVAIDFHHHRPFLHGSARACSARLENDCRPTPRNSRRRRRARPAALVATLAVALIACRPVAEPSNPPRSAVREAALTADVVHSWTSGGELKAVAALAEAFNARGGTWRDAAVAGFDNAGALGINRMVGGQPPGAMAFVAGPALDDLAARGMLTPISDLSGRRDWPSQLPPALIAAVTRGGQPMAVPLNLHAQSLFFWSRAVLAKAGITRVPANWPEFFTALDAVRAQGSIPLALGGQAWQESILFNAVLASVLGKPGFEKVYLERDTATILGPGFRQAVEIFGRLRRYVDANAPGRNWNDAAQLVIAERAALLVMGDWALSEFALAAKAPDVDFSCRVGLRDDLAVVGSDVMAFPRARTEAARRAQRLLAEVVLDPQVQHEFARRLGPLPARMDAPVNDLHPCMRHAAGLMRTAATVVPTPYMTLPPDVLGEIDDVIAEFWSDPSMSAQTMARRFADVLRTAT
jgi:glucose/mannose transport system substrate-binding protein